MINDRSTCGVVNQRKNLLAEAIRRREKGVEAAARFAIRILLVYRSVLTSQNAGEVGM
jgi:hypothetical protein